MYGYYCFFYLHYFTYCILSWREHNLIGIGEKSITLSDLKEAQALGYFSELDSTLHGDFHVYNTRWHFILKIYLLHLGKFSNTHLFGNRMSFFFSTFSFISWISEIFIWLLLSLIHFRLPRKIMAIHNLWKTIKQKIQ